MDKQLELLKSDIRDIHRMSGKGGSRRLYSWGTPAFFLLNALLLALFLGTHLYLRKCYGKTSGRKRRMNAGKQAMARLAEAEQSAGEGSQKFFSAVSQAVSAYLSGAFGLQQADMTAENVKARLIEDGVAEADAEALLNVMRSCEMAQYSPLTDSQRTEVAREARQTIEKIQKCVK